MAQDWLADVRTYDANADENVVAAIVRYCGIALRSENASKVTFSESEETDRVRDNFLKKKLGRTEDDATLDAAIQSVGASMGGGTRNRVSLYYLLTRHFDMLAMFGGGAAAASGAAAAAPPAPVAPVAAASPVPPPAPQTPPVAETPIAAAAAPIAAHPPTRPSGGGGGGAGRRADDDAGGGWFGIGCLGGLVMLGAILIAALIAIWAQKTILTSDAAEEPAAATAAPAEPAPEATETPEPEVPDGAGVTATERDGKPMLSVYFDSGSSDVAPDFNDVAADVLAYLEANPDSSVTISGYNDPSGNAALNAELSKNRAQAVQAALVAAGVAEDRTELVKPDDTTTTDMTAAEARRVEIVVSE